MATSISPPSFLIRAGRPSCNLCKIAKALFSQYTCPIPLWLSLPMRQFAAERDWWYRFRVRAGIRFQAALQILGRPPTRLSRGKCLSSLSARHFKWDICIHKNTFRPQKASNLEHHVHEKKYSIKYLTILASSGAIETRKKAATTSWCHSVVAAWRSIGFYRGVKWFKGGLNSVSKNHINFRCQKRIQKTIFPFLFFWWKRLRTFWLRNVLPATTACTFATSQLPKVVRHWGVLYILTSKCASRHNSVHFLDISTSKSGPRMCESLVRGCTVYWTTLNLLEHL